MKSIYFRSEEELIYFCEMIFRKYNEINVQWKKSSRWGNELRLTNNQLNMKQIIPCFIDVFLFFRLDFLIKQIAEKSYYYSDDAEIERICQLTKSIMVENTVAKDIFKQYKSLSLYTASILKEQLNEDEIIHFDALITFCLKPLMERLQIAVGYGIDEMKREEEHQNFIESIRRFLKVRKPKMDILYVVQGLHGRDFSFYKMTGEKYSRIELRTLMINEPLYIIGLDENEFNISPVITLLPEKICIFGKYPTEAKTLTLINLFQERVQFFPLEQFPFTREIK